MQNFISFCNHKEISISIFKQQKAPQLLQIYWYTNEILLDYSSGIDNDFSVDIKH